MVLPEYLIIFHIEISYRGDILIDIYDLKRTEPSGNE